MSDLISRQALIEAVDEVTWYHQNQHGEMVHGANSDEHQAWYKAEDIYTAIKSVPSAQPDHIGEVTEMVGDTISRQVAIDEIKAVFEWHDVVTEDHLIQHFKALPSAQPGWIPWDSGRFPEESGTYTVTAYDGATKRVTYAKYQKRLKRWELTGARAYWRVLAWMEKPKPWEGEKDDG